MALTKLEVWKVLQGERMKAAIAKNCVSMLSQSLAFPYFLCKMAMNAKIWNWKKCSFKFLQIATMNVVCGAIWRVSTFITHSKLPICQNAPYWSVCSNQRWNALKSAGNPSTMLGRELQMKHWWKIINRNAEIKFFFLFDIKLKIHLMLFHSDRCSFSFMKKLHIIRKYQW